jgi:hypothetical protein
VNTNYESGFRHDSKSDKLHDEWIGEDEIIVMPYRKSSIVTPIQVSPPLTTENRINGIDKMGNIDLRTMLNTPKQLTIGN